MKKTFRKSIAILLAASIWIGFPSSAFAIGSDASTVDTAEIASAEVSFDENALKEQALSLIADAPIPNVTPASDENHGAIPSATETPSVSATPDATETPGSMETPQTTTAPDPAETPNSTETPDQTEQPVGTEAPVNTVTPSATPGPTETPAPSAAPLPTETPAVTASPEPSDMPTPTPSITPSASSSPSPSPSAVSTPTAAVLTLDKSLALFGDPNFHASITTGKEALRGETVTVSVALTESLINCGGIILDLAYDTTRFEAVVDSGSCPLSATTKIINVNNSENNSTYNGTDPIRLVFIASDIANPAPINGTVLTVSFVVKADAALGTAAFTLTVPEICDAATNKITGTGTADSMIIVESKAPVCDSLTVSKNTGDRSFLITASGVSDLSGISDVYFAVWCMTEGGQDDLRYYSATRKAEGVYTATVNTDDHYKQSGVYAIHAFGTDGDGNNGFMRLTEESIAPDYTSPTCTSLSATSMPGQGILQISVAGTADAGSGLSELVFAIWCMDVNGQDDLQWYHINGSSATDYSLTVYTANHKNQEGTYAIHLFLTDGAGNSGLAKICEVYVEPDRQPPTCEGLTIVKSEDQRSFSITANGVRDVGNSVSRVYFAVWCMSEGGQDDLQWYDATPSGEESYAVTVSTDKHKQQAGMYAIHAFGVDEAGNDGFMCLKDESILPDYIPPTYVSLSAASVPGEGKIHITVNGVTDSGSGVGRLTFAVWCMDANGQDDLQWYNIDGSSATDYELTVHTANHKNQEGIYAIHLFLADNAGNSGFAGLCETQAYADNQPPTCENLAIQKSLGERSFSITATGVRDAGSDVARVYFAIWCMSEGGQDDLQWYDATPSGEETYTVTVSTDNHKRQAGVYAIHAFGVDQAGNDGFMCLKDESITPDYTPPTYVSLSAASVPGEGKIHITVSGVTDTVNGVTGSGSGVARLTFAVWCMDANGQDDLQWYNIDGSSATDYTLNVYTTNHKNQSGVYAIHLFLTDGVGNNGFAGLYDVPVGS